MAASVINQTLLSGLVATSGDEEILNFQINGSNIVTADTTNVFELNGIFRENGKMLGESYTIPSGANAYSVGPIELAPDVVVTVPDGSVWTVI
jgi:hypothetical protein